MIHGNVKASNIFVAQEMSAKVGGLEFSALCVDNGGVTQPDPRYSAPEVLQGRQYSPAGDVYSLGVVVWELLTGRVSQAAETIMHQLVSHVMLFMHKHSNSCVTNSASTCFANEQHFPKGNSNCSHAEQFDDEHEIVRSPAHLYIA